jgi:GWxTD domain-containing protein
MLAMPPARGAAQTVDDRLAIEAFRDSIATAPDTAELRGLESRLMLAAKRDRANPRGHLSLGYLALQLGNPTDAVAEFKWATELAPKWPLAWFAWGQAELRLGDEVASAATPRQLLVARDAWPRAASAFAQAALLDTDYVTVAISEARRALREGRPGWAGVLRDGLQQAAAGRNARSVPLVLGLGRIRRLVGDTAGALAAFESLTSLKDGRGLGLLELARTRLAAGDDRGIETYFAAADENDSATVAAIRRDLAWVASADELAAFDASRGSGRAQMLWDFWTGRDRDDLRRNGARLAEHYRRLAVRADRYPDSRDERGKVFVRQGDPDTRATLRAPDLPPNESWWYRRPEGDFVVHFVARQDSTDFTLIESLFDLLGGGLGGSVAGAGAGDEAGPPPAVDADRLLRSRAALSPFYQAAVAGRREQFAEFRTRERELGREGMRLALTTDRYPLRFDRDLAARVRIASTYDPGVASEVRVFFAVPGFAIADSDRARAEYPIRVRIDARDTVTDIDRALDTTVTVRHPGPLDEDDLLVGSVALPLRPGTYDVRTALGYRDLAGTLMSRLAVELPGREAGVLALYDLLVAGDDPPTGWTPDGQPPVGVDPDAEFVRSDTLVLYSSLAGLRSAGRGRARVLVRPVTGPDDNEPRWKGFPGRSGWMDLALEPDEAGVAPVRLELPLRRLDRGAWDLELVVVDGAGRTARQRARVVVEDR